MLGVVDQRRELSICRGPKEAPSHRPLLDFELVPTRVATSSACLSMYRARVPGGWLVTTRPHDSLVFVPDPEHAWDGGSVD